MEIESVIRETCDRILSPPPPLPPPTNPNDYIPPAHPITKEKIMLRAIALQILGEAYMNVKKDGDAPDLGEGYVKVDVAGDKRG